MMASPLAADSSRASTPESLAKATTTIDDLMVALSNFSRAPTPDAVITCCCRRDGCEAAMSWASLRTKLESRLVLSAEVGQALLQRHETYVRRQDPSLSREPSSIFSDVDEKVSLRQQLERLTKKLDALTEENSLMESRINELLIKHETSEASNRTLIHELQEARGAIKRLNTQNTRSIGWEMRLTQQTQEKEDMRQERDSESHRAKVAESKAAAFMEKCSKLQNEVQSLREQVHTFRTSRADFSKNVLQETRTRLEALQRSIGRDQAREDPETTRVLESLVADNETLKRDVAELQNLLLEAREDVRTLSDELEEHRALAPPIDFMKVEEPSSSVVYPQTPIHGRTRGHLPSQSLVSGSPMLLSASFQQAPLSRVVSPDSRYHRRSFSVNVQQFAKQGDTTTTEWGQISPTLLHSPSRHSNDLGLDLRRSPSPLSPRTNVKSLMLSSQSRGVQTEDVHSDFSRAISSPQRSALAVDKDGNLQAPESRSDTSSLNQQDSRAPGTVAVLVEKVAGLLVKMTQADVRTLTNRLKRQHLLPSGGDARHVSRSTIGAIVNEVANLRAPTGSGKEDGVPFSSSLAVTRGDIKALLKLFKDAFAELGMLREQINEVIFDPSVAHRLRKEAMEPERGKGEPRPPSAMGGWIAPIQKLFMGQLLTQSSPQETEVLVASGGSNKPAAELGRGKPPARVVPKLSPAISASSTTVKVEFASSGVRKTDTSDGSLRVSSPLGPPEQRPHVTGPTALRKPIAVPYSTSPNLMGIFAGAPKTGITPPSDEPWQLIPQGDNDRTRQVRGAISSGRLRDPSARKDIGTLGRSATTRNMNRLSRNVDAMIDHKDDQVPEFRQTLLNRTLRPRGLSDSSIRTTFLKDEVTDSNPEKHLGRNGGLLSVEPPTLASSPSTVGSQPSSPPKPGSDLYPAIERENGTRSPVARLGRNLASWATAAAGRRFNGADDGISHPDPEFIFGSPREEGKLRYAAWGHRGLQDRDV